MMDWLRSVGALLQGLFGSPSPAPESQPSPASVVIEEVAPGPGPPWGTLSGLAAHPTNPTRLYAVTDADSPPPRIIEIDVSRSPAAAIRQIEIAAPGFAGLDVEAITALPDGSFWVASEGNEGPGNVLLHLDANGRLLSSKTLPPEIVSRLSDRGFEGVAYAPNASGGQLFVALQKPIAGDPDDTTRIGRLDIATGAWTFYLYPLERLDSGDVSGLSELVRLTDGRFAAIERDGKGGRHALKWITTFRVDGRAGAAPGEKPPVLTKSIAVDLVPLFLAADRKVEKEIEGLTVASDGNVYVITDNDGERATLLLRLGQASAVFKN